MPSTNKNSSILCRIAMRILSNNLRHHMCLLKFLMHKRCSQQKFCKSLEKGKNVGRILPETEGGGQFWPQLCTADVPNRNAVGVGLREAGLYPGAHQSAQGIDLYAR